MSAFGKKKSESNGCNTNIQCRGDQQLFATRAILRAHTENERWGTLFAAQGWLTQGLPQSQRRALAVAAAWRLAVVNVRRLARDRHATSVVAIGCDLHQVMARGFAFSNFDRLDGERVAVDALHSQRAAAPKRSSEAAHG